MSVRVLTQVCLPVPLL